MISFLFVRRRRRHRGMVSATCSSLPPNNMESLSRQIVHVAQDLFESSTWTKILDSRSNIGVTKKRSIRTTVRYSALAEALLFPQSSLAQSMDIVLASSFHRLSLPMGASHLIIFVTMSRRSHKKTQHSLIIK
jgi:hypothetical protein